MPNANNETPPASFLNYCRAELSYDDKGEEIALTVSCNLCDRTTGECFQMERTIDLVPLVKFLHRKFAEYHMSLHDGDIDVAGLGSALAKAKNAAKRLASNKGVQMLWSAVKPLTKAVVSNVVPGGAAAFMLAEKTYDIVKSARAGDPKAIAEMKSVANKALGGNELAKEVMKTAKTLNAAQDIKEGKDPADLAHRIRNLESRVNPLLRTSGEDLTDIGGPFDFLKKAAKKVHGVARRIDPGVYLVDKIIRDPKGALKFAKKAAIKMHDPRTALQLAKKVHGVAKKVDPGVALTDALIRKAAGARKGGGASPRGAREDSPEAPEMGDDMEEFDEGMEEVIEGWKEWAHSRPYRSPAQAALQGDFGASTSLRSLYHGGLQTILARAKAA